jgi:Flp pilus assembly CpaE family ATPase
VVAEHDGRIQPSPLALAGTLGLGSSLALPDWRVAARNAENQGRFDAALAGHRAYGRAIAGLVARLGPGEAPAERPGLLRRLRGLLGRERAA